MGYYVKATFQVSQEAIKRSFSYTKVCMGYASLIYLKVSHVKIPIIVVRS